MIEGGDDGGSGEFTGLSDAAPERARRVPEMMARIGMMPALNRHSAKATPAPRQKRAKAGREERYLIVACTVITDVPEAVGP
jgi:hypothetical protein